MSGWRETDSAERPVPILYTFGPFVLDVVRGVLHKDNRKVTLTPKALQLLVALVRRHGAIAEKDELFQELWPRVVVEENTLARHISTLRRALREQPDDPEYIATVPGRGYRFAEPVGEQPAEALKEAIAEDDVSRATPDGPAADRASPIEASPIETGVPARRASDAARRRRHPARHAAWILAGVSIAAALAFAAVSSFGSATHRNRAAPPVRSLSQFTAGEGLQHEPAWSPDGRWIAYVRDAAGNADIWVQPVGRGDPIRVTSEPSCDGQPAWSPDGRSLVFRSDRDSTSDSAASGSGVSSSGGGLFIVPAFGGPARRLTTFGCCARWSPDGRQILFLNPLPTPEAHPQAIYLVSPASGPPTPLLAEALVGFAEVRAAWHPDGRRVSVWAKEEAARPQRWRFRTFSLNGAPVVESQATAAVRQRLEEADVRFTEFTWAPGGDALYFVGRSRGVSNLWRVMVDPATLQWIDGPERLTTADNAESFALSADGQRIVFTMSHAQTRVWEFEASGAHGFESRPTRALTAKGDVPRHLDVAANGARLAYQMTRGDHEEIWVRDLPDGLPRRIAESGMGEALRVLRWSDDGRRLVYNRGGGSQLVLYDSATNSEQILTDATPTVLIPNAWSADGTRLLVGCEREPPAAMAICTLRIGAAPNARSDMRVLAERKGYSLWQARFSPDQRWIAFVAFDERDVRGSTINVMPANGGPWTEITEGRWLNDKPRWSIDGRTLYFISNRSGLFNVWARAFNPATGRPGGAPYRVTMLDSPELTVFADNETLELGVTKDRMYLPLTELTGQMWMLDHVDR